MRKVKIKAEEKIRGPWQRGDGYEEQMVKISVI